MAIQDVFHPQAFDSNHMLLDVDPLKRGEGDSVDIEGCSELITFANRTKVGILHDFDAETHTERRIAYWVINDGSYVAREIWITPWGRGCTRTLTGILAYGGSNWNHPGCHKPAPMPAPST